MHFALSKYYECWCTMYINVKIVKNCTLGSGDQDLPGAAEPGQDDPAAVGVAACSACSSRAVWVQYKSARAAAARSSSSTIFISAV